MLAAPGIVLSFSVVSGTRIRPHPFHPFLWAFSVEGFLPSLAFCHLELFDLIVVDDFIRLLLVVLWLLFVSVRASLALSFLRWFIAVIRLDAEEGRKVHMEAVQENVQVEAVKINDPLVDVLSVEALATVFEKELSEAVH